MDCPFTSRKTSSFWCKLKNFFFFDRVNTSNIKGILDTTIDAIIAINEQKQIIAFNRAAEHIFGYSKDEVFGRNVNMLMPEPFYSQHDSYVDHYLQTGEKRIIGIGREVVAKRKDGSTFPIDLAVTEMVVSARRMFTGIIRDITQKKEAEELKQKNIRMQAEAEAKSEYISILSHELKTPLTAIQGSLGLLLQEKCLAQKSQELLSIAYRNTERLGNIIKAVLDIEKFQEGKIQIDLKNTALVALLKETIATSQFIAEKNDVKLVDQLPLDDVHVLVDDNRLIQVCLNLLSNAIKFSPPGGTVVVSMRTSPGKVCVFVKDSGCGIPEEFHTKMFTPFSQAVGGNRKTEGVGLGLHICKKIIDLFGGSIGFTTEEGKGTTMYFELPLRE